MAVLRGRSERGRRGAWLFSPSTGSRRQISGDETVGDLAWSPDGARLAGIRDPDVPRSELAYQQVVMFPVADLLAR